MIGNDCTILLLQQRLRFPAAPPTPGVAKPELRRDSERRIIGSAVFDSDADKNVVHIVACIFHEYIEVATVIESTGIGKLKFGRFLPAILVLLSQPLIRVF